MIRRIFTVSQCFSPSLTLHSNLNNSSSFVILLICVYLPTDYSTEASHLAFSESLCELDGFISAEHFDSVIIAGDFNVAFAHTGANNSKLL